MYTNHVHINQNYSIVIQGVNYCWKCGTPIPHEKDFYEICEDLTRKKSFGDLESFINELYEKQQRNEFLF